MNDIKRDKMFLPPEIEHVIQTIKTGGFEAYAVGGCVRNSLMGIEPHDYDITTSAEPEDIKKLFRKTFDTGVKHGTVTVVIDKANIEVTSFRIDGEYKDGRRPENVVFTSDLSLDLQRRDFTMNAIAYGTDSGFIDLYGGIEDIGNKIIRGVGDPGKRYGEDALRMLRAIRFAGQLGFEIEKETYEAIAENATLIKKISAERIRDEVVKLILSDFPEKLEMICGTGLAGYIDNELDLYLKKYLKTVVTSVGLCESKPRLRLSLLFTYMDSPQLKRLLNLLKFDNKLRDEIILYSGLLREEIPSEPVGIRRLLSQIGTYAFNDLLCLKTVKAQAENARTDSLEHISSLCEQIINNRDCISMSDLKINGDDLLELGFTRGKQLGQALNMLLNLTLQEPERNNKAFLRSEAARILSTL